VVLRVPSASTRIFFTSWTRISTSRAHPCAYTGPHRTDPGVLPSWYISTTTLKFCRDNATRESYFAALFDWFNIQIFSSYPFYLSWITPDGSNRCSFCRQCSRSSLLTKCNRLCLNLISINLFFITSFDFPPSFCRLLSIGCATALPMGVAPEAIAEFFRV
jgi:hypothetical protein